MHETVSSSHQTAEYKLKKKKKRKICSKKISRSEDNKELWQKKALPLLDSLKGISNLHRKSGERASSDALNNKIYLVFVCSYLSPGFDPSKHEPLFPEDFLSTCLDLYSYRGDFELVLVTNVSRYETYAFYYLMARFPLSSLVVPYSDFERRTSMCNLVVDPEADQVQAGFACKCLFVSIAHTAVSVEKPSSMPSVVHALKNLLKCHPSDFDYQRVFETMWPLNSTWLSLKPPVSPPVSRVFENVKPEYSPDIIESVSKLPPIQIDQKLDIVKVHSLLLSNELVVRKDGEQVELGKAIEGKYTMICCFHAPIFGTEENSILVQSLVNTCSELYAQGKNFEMVVVVKMKKLADYKPVFDRFLSGFPSPCLVIPFEDSKRRDFICNYLKLNDDDVQCLLLDADNKVLLHGYPSFAWSYGADVFPFTDLQKRLEDRWKWLTSSSTNNLVSLLGCNTSDVLKKTDDKDGCCDSVMTMSNLVKNDVVGLYLCVRGDLIPKLKEVYEECKIQGKPFEVLLVYIPFKDTCLDPKIFKLCVDNMLQEHGLSLWYMPFDNSVSHMLDGDRSGSLRCDELFIFRDQGSSCPFDVYGADLIREGGINTYPFARQELLTRELNRVRELTLEKLLVYKTRTHLLKNNERFPVADLKGKNILVWTSYLSELDAPFFEKLYLWYREAKRKCGDEFEVVFVLSDKSEVREDESDDSVLSGRIMPWLVCPFDADHSAFIKKELSFNWFVEFGKDGRVRSLRADYLLDIDVDDCGTIPFGSRYGDLCQDVVCNFFSRYHITMVGW